MTTIIALRLRCGCPNPQQAILLRGGTPRLLESHWWTKGVRRFVTCINMGEISKHRTANGSFYLHISERVKSRANDRDKHQARISAWNAIAAITQKTLTRTPHETLENGRYLLTKCGHFWILAIQCWSWVFLHSWRVKTCPPLCLDNDMSISDWLISLPRFKDSRPHIQKRVNILSADKN